MVVHCVAFIYIKRSLIHDDLVPEVAVSNNNLCKTHGNQTIQSLVQCDYAAFLQVSLVMELMQCLHALKLLLVDPVTSRLKKCMLVSLCLSVTIQ